MLSHFGAAAAFMLCQLGRGHIEFLGGDDLARGFDVVVPERRVGIFDLSALVIVWVAAQVEPRRVERFCKAGAVYLAVRVEVAEIVIPQLGVALAQCAAAERRIGGQPAVGSDKELCPVVTAYAVGLETWLPDCQRAGTPIARQRVMNSRAITPQSPRSLSIAKPGMKSINR